jgi:hypothetical protein
VAYKIFDIESPNSLDAVANCLDDVFEPEYVIDQLKLVLDPRCKQILVETDYSDKDYRSTYYGYYAKKGYRYELGCVRLHFFDGRVQVLPGLELRFNIDANQKPSDTYFGYMVLRPTRVCTVGRSVLAPTAIAGFHGHIITANHKVHLLGHKLVVNGFPYMSQHADIAVCAHASCWGILRHFSERFSKYAEFLTFDITQMAHEFDPGGIVPSGGLSITNAERVFASAGVYPVTVVKYQNDPGFYAQLIAYIESGFPLFVSLERIGHAVTVIGHSGFATVPSKSAPIHFPDSLLSNLVVVDDNFLPYRIIPRAAPDVDDYGIDDIAAFIVPLPEKIYYPAVNAEKLALVLTTEVHLGFDHSALGEPVVRFFLTTTAHLRSFMHANRSQFAIELLEIAMQLNLPQFVWIIEIASPAQWANSTINTRVVVDATASHTEALPIFLMHTADRAYYFDRGGGQEESYIQLSPPANTPLSRMDGKDGNLQTH